VLCQNNNEVSSENYVKQMDLAKSNGIAKPVEEEKSNYKNGLVVDDIKRVVKGRIHEEEDLKNKEMVRGSYI